MFSTLKPSPSPQLALDRTAAAEAVVAGEEEEESEWMISKMDQIRGLETGGKTAAPAGEDPPLPLPLPPWLEEFTLARREPAALEDVEVVNEAFASPDAPDSLDTERKEEG